MLLGIRRLLGLVPTPHFRSADFGPSDTILILKELKRMSETFDSEMTTLRADIAAQSTVIASATEAFRGLAAQLVAAEAAAKNAGATDTQVAGVTNLRQQLEANTTSLAAAIPANTGVATPAPVSAPATAPAASPAPVEPSASPAVTAPAVPVTSTVEATAPVPTSAPVEAATASATEVAALAANQAR